MFGLGSGAQIGAWREGLGTPPLAASHSVSGSLGHCHSGF